MNSAEPLRRESVFFSKLRRRLSIMMERPEKEKPQTLKDVLKRLAESSSLHGIPKIVSAPQIAVKLLWCLLFLATFVVLGLQVYNLFSTYYSNPVDTSVSLKFSPHRFPAITLCNMNPVMDSKMTPELRDVWSPKKNTSSSRKRRNVEKHYDYNKVVHGAKLSDTDISETSIVTSPDKKSSDGDLTAQPITPTPVDRSGELEDTWQQQPSEASSLDNYAHRLEMYENMLLHRIPRAASTSVSSSSLSDSSLDLSNSISSSDSSLSSSSLSDSSPELSSSSDPFYLYNFYDAGYGSYYDDYSDFSSYDSSDNHRQLVDNFRSILSGSRDNWEWLRRRFQYLFKSLPVSERMEIGHNIEDMVLKLSFLGFNRNISMFKRVATPEHGNCYTLDDELFTAWRSGPSNGITLTMNLQNDEYMQGFASGYGVRLVFHDTGTFPLPAAEGITLSPGTDNSISLKLVDISRLGEPYGECTSGEAFYDQFNYNYSSSTCLQICRTKLVLDRCGCVPFDDPEIGLDRHRDAPVCDMTVSAVELCILNTDGFLGRGLIECDCPAPCREHVYEKTLSWRQWPNFDYLQNVLIKEMCRRNMSICNEDPVLSAVGWQKNFLRVQIYYEDLNYEFITEKPSYEFVRFISDVGGTMGLFIGASLLSLMELLQVTLEICLWAKQRWKDRKSRCDVVQVLPAK